MIKIPRVALFRAAEEEFKQITTLLSRHEFSLRVVDQIDEILALINDEGSSFDAIILTTKLAGGASGISTCLSLKANSLLASIPILALMFSKDPAILEAFFSYGADAVMLSPFNADLVYYQLAALARQKRAFDEQVQSIKNSSGLQSSAIGALNSVRDALVLFNELREPIFLNESAEILLGVKTSELAGKAEELQTVFTPWLEELIQGQEAKKVQNFSSLSTFRRSLMRPDGQRFPAICKLTPLQAQGSRPMGFALRISDATDLDYLSNLRLQDLRLRSIALAAACGCMTLLSNVHGEPPLSPFNKLIKLLSQEPLCCELNPTVRVFLEILDLFISPRLKLKVNLKQEYRLAMRSSDLFQILGHTILYAIDQAGPDGETTISTESVDQAGDLTLLISAENKRPSPLLPDDYLSQLSCGNLPADYGDAADAVFGLEAAQEIADRYNKVIEYKQTPSSVKVRLKLPLIK